MYFLQEEESMTNQSREDNSLPTIKTNKTYKRYRNAIKNSILTFRSPDIETMIRNSLESDGLSSNNLLLLFWNASANNELLDYFNSMVFFPAYYSGRSSIRKDEVYACLIDLRHTELAVKKWSANTIDITASKYLTLLKKFKLMEGSANKSITHHYLNDQALIYFIYWLIAIEESSNILSSKWLQYSLMDRDVFIERIKQKKFMKFINIKYCGNRLNLETKIPYEVMCDELKRS